MFVEDHSKDDVLAPAEPNVHSPVRERWEFKCFKPIWRNFWIKIMTNDIREIPLFYRTESIIKIDKSYDLDSHASR